MVIRKRFKATSKREVLEAKTCSLHSLVHGGIKFLPPVVLWAGANPVLKYLMDPSENKNAKGEHQ
jgi:hypothetical protein